MGKDRFAFGDFLFCICLDLCGFFRFFGSFCLAFGIGSDTAQFSSFIFDPVGDLVFGAFAVVGGATENICRLLVSGSLIDRHQFCEELAEPGIVAESECHFQRFVPDPAVQMLFQFVFLGDESRLQDQGFGAFVGTGIVEAIVPVALHIDLENDRQQLLFHGDIRFRQKIVQNFVTQITADFTDCTCGAAEQLRPLVAFGHGFDIGEHLVEQRAIFIFHCSLAEGEINIAHLIDAELVFVGRQHFFAVFRLVLHGAADPAVQGADPLSFKLVVMGFFLRIFRIVGVLYRHDLFQKIFRLLQVPVEPQMLVQDGGQDPEL